MLLLGAKLHGTHEFEPDNLGHDPKSNQEEGHGGLCMLSGGFSFKSPDIQGEFFHWSRPEKF